MIKRFFAKPYRWCAIFTLLLITAFTFTLLDAFVFPKELRREIGEPIDAPAFTSAAVPATLSTSTESVTETIPSSVETESSVFENEAETSESEYETLTETSATTTETTVATTESGSALYYRGDYVSINIEMIRRYNTNVYVADIVVSDVTQIRTAFAKGTYGRNTNEKTSVIAENNNAVFAINGDYYGFRDRGHVLRNGERYREVGNYESLILDRYGNFISLDGNDINIDHIADAWQIWSFGPHLLIDGEIQDYSEYKIGGPNPRTAIGQIGPLHYLVIVCEGRMTDNVGLTLDQLADVFAEFGCHTAYNLDGGGSATMYFKGEVINNPTANGWAIEEREVSDIVYIAY